MTGTIKLSDDERRARIEAMSVSDVLYAFGQSAQAMMGRDKDDQVAGKLNVQYMIERFERIDAGQGAPAWVPTAKQPLPVGVCHIWVTLRPGVGGSPLQRAVRVARDDGRVELDHGRVISPDDVIAWMPVNVPAPYQQEAAR